MSSSEPAINLLYFTNQPTPLKCVFIVTDMLAKLRVGEHGLNVVARRTKCWEEVSVSNELGYRYFDKGAVTRPQISHLVFQRNFLSSSAVSSAVLV